MWQVCIFWSDGTLATIWKYHCFADAVAWALRYRDGGMKVSVYDPQGLPVNFDS